jgi:elongation factor P
MGDLELTTNRRTYEGKKLLSNDVPVALDLPSSVELKIVETDPSIKGASASVKSKPAVLETGLTVSVPEHIANGETIKVNVEDRKFTGPGESK